MGDLDHRDAIKKLLLSASAAATAEAVTYPLDFLKTRLQLNHARVVSQNLFTTLSQIMQKEGVASLYAGCSAAMLRHLPYTSIRVSTFETLRNWKTAASTPHSQPIPLSFLLLSGVLAGGIGQAVAVPADLVKIRFQQNPRAYSSLWNAFSTILAENGISGLWKGSLPAIQRAALVNVGELTTYDAAKRAIVESGVTGGDTVGAHVLSSMCSGLVSAAVSTPADVIKTRLMSVNNSGGGRQYNGMVDCFLKTVAGEGVRGLYKGFLPTWARLGPWQLTFWVTFEQLRKVSGMESF